MPKKVVIKIVKSSKCGLGINFKKESQKGKYREGKGPGAGSAPTRQG